MKGLREKFRKNEGFTMVELLIVVAIIAILVAVSIPMMNSALEKSRHAVDAANYRDAIALASVKYVTDADAATKNTWVYCVDDKHQGVLLQAEDTTYKAVKPECLCDDGKKLGTELKVNVVAPTGTQEAPTITLSWTINDTTGAVTENESFEPISTGGTGG